MHNIFMMRLNPIKVGTSDQQLRGVFRTKTSIIFLLSLPFPWRILDSKVGNENTISMWVKR